ncbi:DUF3455 domain-containing protein [Methylocella sp.]|uniref:DUF3455 domain-containing protein n=1 Tax=Methylocella sp. TaxID=1978226 RepID=UPI003784D155
MHPSIPASPRLARLVAVGLAAAPCAARAQDAPAAPGGSNLVLSAVADGVQIYVCAKKGDAFVWTFDAPAAALFDASGREIGLHGKGPVWRLSDGSAVAGETVETRQAPDGRSIPWLTLKATAHPGDPGRLSRVTSVRRIDTVGGLAPQGGCDGARLGDTARMRYSARYEFYGDN